MSMKTEFDVVSKFMDLIKTFPSGEWTCSFRVLGKSLTFKELKTRAIELGYK